MYLSKLALKTFNKIAKIASVGIEPTTFSVETLFFPKRKFFCKGDVMNHYTKRLRWTICLCVKSRTNWRGCN